MGQEGGQRGVSGRRLKGSKRGKAREQSGTHNNFSIATLVKDGDEAPPGLAKQNKHEPLTILWQESPRHRPKKISLTKREERHFKFSHSQRGKLARLRQTVAAFPKFDKPRDIAYFLNSFGLTTACGERWTPQLAGFLVAYLEQDHAVGGDRDIIHKSVSAVSSTGLFAKVERMSMRDTVALWRNAIRILADDEQRPKHAEAQKALDAINGEWARRRREPSDEKFPWPTTVATIGSGGIETAGWIEEGVLKFVGYSVGNTNREPQRIRERILSELFRGTIPPVFPSAYLDEWGDPLSVCRLRKMAETIAAFARNGKRQRRSRMAAAVRDWEHDLDYLYREYYVEKFHFDWPSSHL